MCESIAEGGYRCSAHTRPVYEKTRDTFLAKKGSARTSGDYFNMFADTKAFASTPKGNSEVNADIAKYEDIVRYRDGNNSDTVEIIDILKDALVYGDMSLKQHEEVEKAVKEAVAKQGNLVSEDPFEVLKTAVALGLKNPPSFPGSKYFPLYISQINYDHDSPDGTDQQFLGDYPTKELAEKALITWIKEKFSRKNRWGMQILDSQGDICWIVQGETDWAPGEKATDAEIVYHFFSLETDYGYFIDEKTLTGELQPEAKYGERSIRSVIEDSKFTSFPRHRF